MQKAGQGTAEAASHSPTRGGQGTFAPQRKGGLGCPPSLGCRRNSYHQSYAPESTFTTLRFFVLSPFLRHTFLRAEQKLEHILHVPIPFPSMLRLALILTPSWEPPTEEDDQTTKENGKEMPVVVLPPSALPTAVAAAPTVEHDTQAAKRKKLPVEFLHRVDVCVATPAVTERWPLTGPSIAPASTSTSSGAAPAGASLSWEELRSRVRRGPPPFLHVYAVEDGEQVVSSGMALAMTEAAMRALRHQLWRLLCAWAHTQRDAKSGEEDYSGNVYEHSRVSEATRQMLQRCCRRTADGTSWTVLWDAGLTAAVADTIPLHRESAAATATAITRAATAPAQVVHDAPESADGMEAWSDSATSACSAHGSDVEARVVWQTRRDAAAVEAQSQAETETEGEESSGGNEAVVRIGRENALENSRTHPESPDEAIRIPLQLRGVPVTDTLLHLFSGAVHSSSLSSVSAQLRVAVTITSLDVVSHSTADTNAAESFVARLYEDYLVPASQHIQLGTASFHAYQQRSSANPSGSVSNSASNSTDESAVSLEETLDSYMAAASVAQQGVLLPLEEAPRRRPVVERWEGEEAAGAEESRRRVYDAIAAAAVMSSLTSPYAVADSVEDKNGGRAKGNRDGDEEMEGEASIRRLADRYARFCDGLLNPMRVPGESFYNGAILRVPTQPREEELASSDGGESGSKRPMLLTAARAAMTWRSSAFPQLSKCLRSSTGDVGSPSSSSFSLPSMHSLPPPPPPTALQLVLYSLTRALITATANAALVATAQAERWKRVNCTVAGDGRASTILQARWDRFAESCETGSALALRLLQWHAPYPLPCEEPSETATAAGGGDCGREMATEGKTQPVDSQCASLTAARAEAAWCLSMHCKLRLRGATLREAAGNRELAQRCRQQLLETTDRWARRRTQYHDDRREASATIGPWWARASTTPEVMVSRVAAEDWDRLLKDVRVSLVSTHRARTRTV